MQPLGKLTPDEFLERYWQKRPLLVRGAMAGFESPLSPEELAGLACEDGVEARLVLESGGAHPWEVRHGPFDADEFGALPETNWTLLVQRVDRLLPRVAALLEPFRFFPNWRIDDVMVSYAAPGGSVGPHVDSYDVFLLQGRGRRRWAIGDAPLRDERCLPDLDLRVLSAFEPAAEWVLEPGDMLYLPPRLAHHGVAVEACLTFSIGFRAPGEEELLAAFVDRAVSTLARGARYADPDRRATTAPGRIDDDVRAWARGVLRRALDDDRDFDRFLGQFLTLLPIEDDPAPPAREIDRRRLAEWLRGGGELQRRSVTDFAYIECGDGRVDLFVGGEEFRLDGSLADAAPLLAGTGRLDASALGPRVSDAGFVELLLWLVNAGWLLMEHETD